jgi:hypothetical protein
MAHIEVDLYLHVRVLIAIILGLSVTRLLGGIAQFMRQSDHHRLSWIHLAWVAGSSSTSSRSGGGSFVSARSRIGRSRSICS